MTAPKRRRQAAPTPAEPAIEGMVVDAAATTRAGEDTRRRGWFWHWNSIVTQFAPLIGLKGVGLLNSYTVWTDRREESPHRGYAFPSQQSEADFYGEDRAELITINKILVALDLIEIRKEMVLRTDPQGRRWRVPHNFYRVKDHADDFTLTTRQVMAVAQLADRDKAVYRYVRRIFSPRFSPIDSENVWHGILTEASQTELWQRLAERAAKEEHRASARTKAGHAARRAGAAGENPKDRFFVPKRGDEATTEPSPNDSGHVITVESDETIVATTNRGSMVDVDPVNTGSSGSSSTMVAPANAGPPTAVALSNTTYYQSLTTTTTPDPIEEQVEPTPVERPSPLLAGGPDGATPPTDAPGEATAIRAFVEANDRPATPAERKLLVGLAERFSATAAKAPGGAPKTGWLWVTAAIYEAVEAGSSFVAPRRLREILLRWERDGYPQTEPGDAPDAAQAQRLKPVKQAAGDDLPARLGDMPDLRLPHGQGSRRTWEHVVTALASAIERSVLVSLVDGTGIVAYRDGEVQLAAPDPVQAEQLVTTYRGLIERKLSQAMRRPIRLAVVTPDDGQARRPAFEPPEVPTESLTPGSRRRATRPEAMTPDDAITPPSFVIAECGLWAGQVWAAVLAELERHDAVGRADFEAWLRATQPLGRAGEGGPGSPLVVGVPHALAQRRVSSRYQDILAAVLARVVGVPVPVEIAVTRDWLAQHPAPITAGDDGEPERAVGA
jgi:hypothetical protein